ncbi:internalin [Hexamita inflata]|uniref:Internalin n=1 Tax=Hexamita inflata TaxID=28002 RepID=A0AA86QNB9_9EUKA|nr:internalin [Hexamita inflata]CAI9959812.1 internalin [Hexamita inflata]
MHNKKRKNIIKKDTLKINKDRSLNNLSFTQRFQLNQLYITKCPYVSFQYAFSQTCTVFQADDCQIESISGIEQNQQLRSLCLIYNKIKDISPIRTIKSLDTLNIGNNKIQDISPLNQLTNLKILKLFNNNISDISQIKDLRDLKELDVSFNQITSLHSIKKFKSLKVLHANNNKITDLYEVQYLNNLTSLYVGNNEISDLSPLSACSSLSLLIENNQITDASPLQHIQQLSYVQLEQNFINDFQALTQLQNYTKYNFKLGNQQQPSLAQIQTSARMKTISTTRSHLENISSKRTVLQSHFNSVTNKSELLIDAITNVQLNLSRKLLQVFGTIEDASQ